MTFYVENETESTLPFDTEQLAKLVIEKVLDIEACPFETEVSILLTDNEGIKRYNKEFRGIEKDTDVLSFPNLDYDSPSDFSCVEGNEIDFINPESNEIILGDIIISINKVYSQAEEYGHTLKREFAFLIVHSMLHLLGYDHMDEEDAAIMEPKQEAILNSLNITRE